MRFIYKRPRMEQIHDDLNTVMEVMVSDVFICMDLFIFSIIFTLLLSPVIQSIVISILLFIVFYSLFVSLYFLVFNRIMKKS
ncbi:antibiotic biosynthesis monooxygenase (ABM) superfamily enzyme [Bacillus sp. SORGH_AS 510]|uniref:hypothetical protein n=1 Tax=Bacillus sp. SORGH_AS_0510 TaxID=3041771 RepID=UPI00277E7198|nr:hypothetical protein [Bacillus sp. SORGH_AS_0510]MDQ1145357.1 antibiotic biosynthesis monooxygenase (ABM) superfamily enzyme [Bacillus sp. SORGH_AS_0510]